MKFGELVRDRRKQLGLTQAELGELIGLSAHAEVSNIEHERRNLTEKSMRRIADALGCELIIKLEAKE